jgi:HSP20 family protein
MDPLKEVLIMLPIRVPHPHAFQEFSRLADLPRRIDGLFDRALCDTRDPGFRVDAREVGDSLRFEAELPGLKKDDLDITLEDGVLTIAAEYKQIEKQENDKYHIRERRHGRYQRTFRLPETADAENVTADLKDGVLTVTVGTREEARPRRIEVK